MTGRFPTPVTCHLSPSLTSASPPLRLRPLYEAHLPAQQPPPQAHSRLPRPHADALGTCRALGASAQGAQKTRGVNSGPIVSETFSRDDRLRKRREFEECYASGVRVSGRHIQVFLLAGASPGRPRLGISVPRRAGNAVERNRVRRRLREIFRRNRGLLTGCGARLVVNARPSAAGVSFQELSEDYSRTVRKAATRPPG